MATINLEYYSGKDEYNDGAIEQELLEYYKDKKNNKLNLFREDTFYITSPIRENIINWYPFKKDAVALEIGGGMGPITGALCDKCKKVVSVENSKRRVSVLYERHKTRKNLEIYAANVQDVDFKEKFDYVILIGVFEYSKIFFSAPNPFEYFLNYLKTLIKKDGKIIIAIENRYGIKYFSGVGEDHYGKPFVGLKGYNHLNIQTLGKEEWIHLLKKCNLTNYKFYYPYPDYKMPAMIYSDNRMPSFTETSRLPIFNYAKEYYSFDYREVLNGILENKMFGFFSNSFLIEIGTDKEKLSGISYAKVQNNRNNLYKNMTIIHDDNIIEKIPMSSENIGLKELYSTHKKLDKLKIPNSKIVEKNKKLEIEYIKGLLASDYIYELYINKNESEILKFLDEYNNYLINISDYKKMTNPIDEKLLKIFKDKTNVLKYGLLDLNLSNVIYQNNKFILIDQELATNYEIPVCYVLYFSIDLLYKQIPELEKLITKNDLLKRYNISNPQVKCLIKSATTYFEKLNYFDKDTLNYTSDKSKILFIKDEINKMKEEQDCIINNLILERDNYKNICNQILNSRGWKFLEKLRKIKQKIMK